MAHIPRPVRLILLAAAVGVASLRYHEAGQSSLPGAVGNARYLSNPDREPDAVSLADRKWGEIAAREQFGRGPVGYVGEFPTAFENELHFYRACYALAPTIVVPGRAANRVIVDRPGTTIVQPGQP